MKNLACCQHQSLLDAFANWWRKNTKNRHGSQELEKFDPQELHKLALDAGVDSAQLKALAAKWPDSASQLSRRLDALHIAPEGISQLHPAVANDLRRLCSLCASKIQCEHDLDRDPSDPGWRSYCPNEQTLIALSDEERRDRESRTSRMRHRKAEHH